MGFPERKLSLPVRPKEGWVDSTYGISRGSDTRRFQCGAVMVLLLTISRRDVFFVLMAAMARILEAS